MTPSTTDMTSKQLTTMVIYWLNKNEYSKNHWNVVANEMMEKAENDKEIASHAALVEHSDVIALISKEVNTAMETFSKYERVLTIKTDKINFSRIRNLPIIFSSPFNELDK